MLNSRHRRLHATAAAFCLGTAPLSAIPAGAGSLLLQNVGIGDGAVTLNIESFQEKKYTATIAQQYDFSCGSAALATLLTYNYNVPVSEQDVFKDMFENGDKTVIAEPGFSLLDIKNYLTRRGLESNGYRAPLEKLAGVRLPAIVLVNVRGYAHFVVLDGIRDGWILLSDPANGMRSEPIGEFENHWTGIFFLILTNAEQAQEHFNEKTKRAAAPNPPWELTRNTVDLATTLARPAMLGLGGAGAHSFYPFARASGRCFPVALSADAPRSAILVGEFLEPQTVCTNEPLAVFGRACRFRPADGGTLPYCT